MAYDFLGTIESIEKFEEFEEMVNIEITKVARRINHLEQEKQRLEELLDKFKGADAELRSDYKLSEAPDVDYVKRPRPREIPFPNIPDGLNAMDVNLLKVTFMDTIKHRRERNEFKVKRIRDLIWQYTREITFLENQKEDYADQLSRIRGRFGLKDFSESKVTAEIDPKDVVPGVALMPKGQGQEIVDGVKYFLVLSINGGSNTITFDTQAPAVKSGKKIEILGGQNVGYYTVVGKPNSLTVKVLEPLTTENPSTSKVKLLEE